MAKRGRPTIPPTVVFAAMQLLERNHSIRSVAKMLGLSMGAVHGIAKQRHQHQVAGTAVELPRCTQCGGKLVIVPCQTCKIRNRAA